jgi:O-antigen/teichoic acid export membrane protein
MQPLSPEYPVSSRALFKNMLKGSTLYMIAMAGPSLVGFILVPIVTRHMTTSAYGVLDLLQQVGVVISVLLGLNFASALGYFYFEPGAFRPTVVGTTLTGALLFGTVAGVLGCIFAKPISQLVFKSPEYVPYLRLMFAGMPFGFLLEAGLGWLRTEDRAPLFTGAVFMRLTLILSGTLVLLLGFGLRIGAVLGANLLAAAMVAMGIAAAAFRFHGLSVDRALFSRMVRFAWPMSLSALALFLIHFADRFILARYRPLTEVGIYAVAYKLGMLLNPIQAAFESYWASQVYAIIKRADAAVVFARTFTYLVLVISFAGLGILVATRPLLRVLAPPAYFQAAAVVPIIVLAYYIRAIGDYFRILFLANGLPRHDAVCNWITAAVSLLSYFVLIPLYGMYGAAAATLLSFICALILSMLWGYRVWPYQLEIQRIGKLFIVTGGLAAIHLALPHASASAEILRGLLILLAFGGLSWSLRIASPGEKQVMNAALDRIFRRRKKLRRAGP